MQYLKLTLCGVLQSYGGPDSGWVEIRNTENHPTASAVAGLIACSLGIKKNTPQYDHLRTLDYRSTADRNAMLLYDYQIVSPKEPGKSTKESTIRRINGTRHALNTAQRPITKVYLQNASFSVLVGSESAEELREIHAAIRNPRWLYFLGRACCTPSREIVPAEFEAKPLDEYEGEYICI